MLLATALSASFDVALAWPAQQPAPTVILGTAPGGIAQMCLSAHRLSLGVPPATAFDVTRVARREQIGQATGPAL